MIRSIVTVARELISRYFRKYLYLVYKVVFKIKDFALIAQTKKC